MIGILGFHYYQELGVMAGIYLMRIRQSFTWNSQEGVDTLKMLDRMMFADKSHPKAGNRLALNQEK